MAAEVTTLDIATMVGLTVTSLGLIATTVLGVLNWHNSKRLKYIETVSIQRIEWINMVRDRFSKFTSEAHFEMLRAYDYVENKDRIKYDNSTQFNSLAHLHNDIELYLNPRETVHALLSEKSLQLVKNLSASNVLLSEAFDYEENKRLLHQINYLHQVILKSEWFRFIEEAQEGKGKNSTEVEELYKNVAREIDVEKAKMIYVSSK